MSADDPTEYREPREEVLRRLLDDLDSNSAWTRRSALQALSTRRAVPEDLERPLAERLIRLLDDSDPRIRQASAQAIGHLAGPLEDQAKTSLRGLIGDQNGYVSASAIHSLGLLGATSARREILESLSDPNTRVQSAAIMALQRLGPPEIGRHFMPFLDSSNPYVLASAATALGNLRHEPAGPKLLSNLQRFHAGGGGVAASGSHRPMWTYQIPRCHMIALSRVGYRPATDLLVEIAQYRVGLRSSAVAALADLAPEAAARSLAWLLKDPSRKLRQSLLELLDRANLVETAPFVRPLLQDGASENRKLALAMLDRWRDPGSLDAIRQLCHQEQNAYIRPMAVSALAHILGPKALTDLLALSDDAIPSVRGSVAEALGQMEITPSEDVLRALRRLMQDPDAKVSEAARLSLASLSKGAKDENTWSDLGPSNPPALLVPFEIWDDIPRLRALLATWQANLGSGSGEHRPELVSEIDRCLSRLLECLDESVQTVSSS